MSGTRNENFRYRPDQVNLTSSRSSLSIARPQGAGVEQPQPNFVLSRTTTTLQLVSRRSRRLVQIVTKIRTTPIWSGLAFSIAQPPNDQVFARTTAD